MVSVTSAYRHENQNSIYYLKPNSSTIYLLNFKLKYFCAEVLKWKRGSGLLPFQATSQQTSDAAIFVIGGFRNGPTVNGVSEQPSVLRDCL